MGTAAWIPQRSFRLALRSRLGGASRHAPFAVNRIDVVAAVLVDRLGRYLLARRPEGKPYAGYWEFPGGKVEPEETLQAALARELREELGIEVRRAFPWITRHFDYPHACVRLHFFRVVAWDGTPQPLEDQSLAWQGPGCETVAPMLPANAPVLRAAELPVVYGITNGSEVGEPTLLEGLERAFFRGLRLVQVREKDLPSDLLFKLTDKVVRAARPWHARVLVNGDVEVAKAAGADGVHLTSRQLADLGQRPDLPLVAASCHDEAELQRAEQLGVDFAVLGSIAPTVSHPERTPLGFRYLARVLEDCSLPVLGIGGLGLGELETAWEAGAHGIASMRAVWAGDAPIPSRFRLQSSD
ncbi:MAG: Nudix family hydrolase [Betaproteobacteria bacterium]|nr:Nudix family hydrolase [Betaproteobacteria bacterium]